MPWAGFGASPGRLIICPIAGFFGARKFFKYELKKNPPINEKMIPLKDYVPVSNQTCAQAMLRSKKGI